MNKKQYMDFLKKHDTEMLAIIMEKYKQDHPNASEYEIAQEYRKHLDFINIAEDFANDIFTDDANKKDDHANSLFHGDIKYPIVISATVCAFLLMALFPMSYGFYTFLRIVVALFFGCQCYHAYKFGNIAGAVIPFLIALLYNPIIPIHLERDIWIIINIAVMVFILLQIISLYIHNKSSKKSK